jgi:hypothetical protein
MVTLLFNGVVVIQGDIKVTDDRDHYEEIQLFTAADQCCECGGGTTDSSGVCTNDDSTVDTDGDTCTDYYDDNPDDCGLGDYDGTDDTDDDEEIAYELTTGWN